MLDWHSCQICYPLEIKLLLLLLFCANSGINRLEIIAKRGIIARLSYTTSFELYEKVDFKHLLTFWPLHKKVACYRFLHILTESEQTYFHQNFGEK